MNLLLATLAVPLATAGIGAVPGPRRPKEALFLGGLAATFVLALATAGRYLAGETPAAFGGALRVDGLSALVLVLTAFVGLLSGLYSVGYLERNERSGFVSARQRTELLALRASVDEGKLAQESQKPQTYKWPGATLKDGSVADY